jgi:hypothetical protein
LVAHDEIDRHLEHAHACDQPVLPRSPHAQWRAIEEDLQIGLRLGLRLRLRGMRRECRNDRQRDEQPARPHHPPRNPVASR